MKPLNQTFNEFKKNLPPYVLWMLLAAAFLVVVILLFLLLSGPKKNTVTAGAAIDGALIIDPDAVEMRGITVGNMGETRITVSANTAMRITDVFLDDNIDGLSIRNSTCQNIGIISERAPCVVTIEWKPVNELKDTGTKINIKYHLASQSIEMSHIETVPVLISARRAEIIAEPVPAPEPFFDTPAAPEPTLDFTFDFDEFANIFEETAPTVVAPVAPPRPEPVRESCFDFAMPGYNLSGRHAGWIRPSAGRYLFHPFADTECKNPIGEYNPNTGLITDINNPSRTIGSDVDSIGGRGIGANLAMPILSNPVPTMPGNRARQVEGDLTNVSAAGSRGSIWGGRPRPQPSTSFRPSSLGDPRGGGMGATEATVSSVPYDRTFVLRQYKPIPATIVNEVRADAKNQSRLPVQATVDRHVYSDNGRTIIVPAGTLMLGWAHGDLPGPYKSIGRMQISWYRFVRPDGVEFNFMGDENTNPFSGDSQGRVGVPGRGSTDYLESMIMPMMTALVPAAVNLIAPISDRFVNQINLDNNTVTQSGQVRSSELAKQEIITTWNRVVQKLALDIMDNTVPPFSIAAGTRITVFSPTDLVVTCGDPADTNDTRNCAMIAAPSTDYAVSRGNNFQPVDMSREEWIGQARSFNIDSREVCEDGRVRSGNSWQRYFNDFRAAEFWCQANQYQGRSQAQWNAFYNQQQQGIVGPSGQVMQPGSPEFNQNVLGLQYNDQGLIQNPFAPTPSAPAAPTILCPDTQTPPDSSGCCMGEILTDMGDQGWNCCPSAGGDCFPPIL